LKDKRMKYFNFLSQSFPAKDILFGICFLFLSISVLTAQDNRIKLRSGQQIFSSGMNMAWASNFAGNAVNLNEQQFIDALDDISEAGGNTMRWWLHINGSQSPLWENDTVSGLSTEVENLRRILDLAYARGMTVAISLWSHDMLSDEGQNLDAIEYMLEDTTGTMAYVNNALIPLVEGVKGHPGILCWEIINEPEGMLSTSFPEVPWGGWTDRKTTYDAIQRFTNLCAGAIHRTDPEALVTTGAHRIAYVSNIGSVPNNYADSVLIAAGGDTMGYLDFYEVHYYPSFGTGLSPFAYPISHWKVDKPLVVGEFSAFGPEGEGLPPTPEQAYKYLYDNGYAGGWSWTWTGHDGNGDVTDAAPGMMYLKKNHPDDIIIELSPGYIENFEIEKETINIGDSTLVRWKASDSSLVTLNDSVFNTIDSIYLAPDTTTQFTLIAMSDTHADTVIFTITVLQLGTIEYFFADPHTIDVGDSTLLKWNVVGGDCCSIVTLNGDTVNGSDSLFVTLFSDSTFTLATDGPNPDTSTITVIVEEKFTYFEAENASTTGEVNRINNSMVSGGAYLELRADWTITWRNIIVPDDGEYMLRIGYQLTFDTPKSQYLVINGDTVATVEFTAPNSSVWLTKDLLVSLQKGTNSIAFHGFWNWMSLDYIAVQGAIVTSIAKKETIPENMDLAQNYPNPFNPSTTIEFTLKKTEKVSVTVYNVLGKKIKTLYNGITPAGINSIEWYGDNDLKQTVSSGIYFYRLQTESGFIRTKKMILMK